MAKKRHWIKNITIDEFATNVKELLDGYSEEVNQAVEQELTKIGNEGRDSLKSTTQPKQSKKGTANKMKRREWINYVKGWRRKITKDSKNKTEVTIYNSISPQLTHLLEYGHATRDGQRTRGFAHVKPIEKKIEAECVDRLKKVIDEIN